MAVKRRASLVRNGASLTERLMKVAGICETGGIHTIVDKGGGSKSLTVP